MISFIPGDMCVFNKIEEIVVQKVGKIIRSDENMVLIQTTDGREHWASADQVRVIRKWRPEEE